MNELLGIDIGTSSCKVDLFRPDGESVASASGSYPVICPAPGIAEQNPDDWWAAVCGAIREVLEKSGARDIAAIGIDAQSWSAIPIAGNEVLHNTPIWTDMRAQRECEWANARVGEARLFACGGNPMKPSYSLPKLLWYRNEQPEVYARAEKILQANSFIAWRLTGEIAQDVCMSYGYQCFDMARGRWDEAILAELGIRRELLPEIVECDAVIGGVTEEAARQTGLLSGTPVVIGGLDAACGALGAGVYTDGQTQEQGGQAGGMSICLSEMKADPRLILSRHVVRGKFLLQGGTVGGSGALKWLSEQLCLAEKQAGEKRGASVFEEMSRAAETIAPGSDGMLFLPYMSGERSPIWNPNAEGVYYGVDFSKTRAHMIRACMEGVAYSLRHNCRVAEDCGAKIDRLFSMGGAANSLVWTQIKSDVTGYPIDVPNTSSATTLGAAIVAGVGTGVYADYESAVKQTVRFKRHHEPNAATAEIYARGYERYLELYRSLEHMMQGNA